jgi:hypothetical protein
MFKQIPSGVGFVTLAVIGMATGWLSARAIHRTGDAVIQRAESSEDLPAVVLTKAAEAPRKFVVRNIPRDQFCKSMQGMLASWGAGAGFDERRSTIMATSVTSELVDSFRTGRATDWIDQQSLVRLMNRERAETLEPGYIPLAAFLAPAMGTRPGATSVALSSGELRFIPHAQRGTDIVVIAQSAAPLTPERARTVADVARKLDIRLSVVWVGTPGVAEENAQEDRSALAFLTSITGGGFVDLGGEGCGRDL